MDHVWTCACCGERFDTLPMEYAVPAPRAYFALPEAEREGRALLTDDLCIIDDKERYLRGCLELPVIDGEGPLIFVVWVSLSWRASSNFGTPPSSRMSRHGSVGWKHGSTAIPSRSRSAATSIFAQGLFVR